MCRAAIADGEQECPSNGQVLGLDRQLRSLLPRRGLHVFRHINVRDGCVLEAQFFCSLKQLHSGAVLLNVNDAPGSEEP